MRFLWDAGNINHIAIHGVTPDEAEQVIANNPIDVGTIVRNGERRILHLGETDSGRVLLIVITERGAMHRVVTARPAERKERAIYAAQREVNNEQDPRDP